MTTSKSSSETTAEATADSRYALGLIKERDAIGSTVYYYRIGTQATFNDRCNDITINLLMSYIVAAVILGFLAGCFISMSSAVLFVVTIVFGMATGISIQRAAVNIVLRKYSTMFEADIKDLELRSYSKN